MKDVYMYPLFFYNGVLSVGGWLVHDVGQAGVFWVFGSSFGRLVVMESGMLEGVCLVAVP